MTLLPEISGVLNLPNISTLRRHPLVTPRLYLTPPSPMDAEDLWRAVDSTRASLEPWLSWVPLQTDLEASERFLRASAEDWEQGSAVRLSVRDRVSMAYLGVVSFENLQHTNLSGDLGYWLHKSAEGKGVMLEAASACIYWAFHELKAHRIRVAASTKNTRSLALIQRLGFRFEGIAREAEFVAGRWLDHAIFARLATDP